MGIIKKRYYTANRQIVGYKDGVGRKDYLTDNLGSVIAEVAQDGLTKTYEGRYKPYGGTQSSAGTSGRFGWVGTLGYRGTGLANSSHYMRARHYSQTGSSWTSIDPLWPDLESYSYVVGRPTILTDFTGLDHAVCVSGSNSIPLWGGIVDLEVKYKICATSFIRTCCPKPGATVCFTGEIGAGLHISGLGIVKMIYKSIEDLVETIETIEDLIEQLSHLSVQPQDAEEGCPEKGFFAEPKACIELCLGFVTLSGCCKPGGCKMEPPEYGLCDPGVGINATDSFKYCY